MNITMIGIAILGTAELLLLVLRIRRVVIHHRGKRIALSAPPEVALLTPPKKKRGRPRKDTTQPRHLYLPQDTDETQLEHLSELFSEHQGENGAKVVLHIPSSDGFERNIELPYRVQWSEGLKDDLASVLGGWA